MLGPIAATRSAGSRAELTRQRVDRGDGGPRRGPAPAGVNGGDSARRGIGNQQRHAVRRPDGDRDGRVVGNEDVGVHRILAAPQSTPDRHDRIPVDLIHPGDLAGADRRRELGYPSPPGDNAS